MKLFSTASSSLSVRCPEKPSRDSWTKPFCYTILRPLLNPLICSLRIRKFGGEWDTERSAQKSCGLHKEPIGVVGLLGEMTPGSLLNRPRKPRQVCAVSWALSWKCEMWRRFLVQRGASGAGWFHCETSVKRLVKARAIREVA